MKKKSIICQDEKIKKCSKLHFFFIFSSWQIMLFFFILTNYVIFFSSWQNIIFFEILPLWALLWQIDLALFVVSEICLFWGFRLSWVQRRPLCLTAIREDRFFSKWGFFGKKQVLAHQTSCASPVTECTIYSFCGSVCRAHPPLCTQKEFQKSENCISGRTYTVLFVLSISSFVPITAGTSDLVS